MSEALSSRKENGILWLTMNRAAFVVPLMQSLQAAITEAGKDAEVKTVVITGPSRVFNAGQDLKEHAERKPKFINELRDRYNPLILSIRRLPKPVIAAVGGAAAGAGMSLALACDFRICTPETKFYTSFIKLGLVPDSGSLFWLGIQIGFSRAFELEMTGRPVTAEEAERWGLVSRIATAGHLLEDTAIFAKTFAEGPSQAFALIKQMYNRTLFARNLEDILDDEALSQEVAGRTQDHAEGLKAFFEKRPPQFTGR